MSRIVPSLIWLIGGIIGTVAIPVFLYLVLAVLQKSGATEGMMHFLKVLMGISVYVLVPVGILLSAFMAFVTFRRLGRETEKPNQSVQTTALSRRV